MAQVATLKRQYEAWPYPQVPWMASVPPLAPWQLHLDSLRHRCGIPPQSGRGKPRQGPRIWIAGCGTFQPHVLATANPKADVLASDLSQVSLRRARRRCWVHGQSNVRFAPVDLSRAGDPGAGWPEGPFDWIECYGVLMNLPDPAASLRALAERLAPDGVLRVMVYPRWSRHRIFQVQRVAKLMGFTAERRSHPAQLRNMMLSLDRSHPLRRAFASYRDTETDAGVVDAFLHAGDRGFGARELVDMAGDAGLELGSWFHRPWAQPEGMRAALGMERFADPEVLDQLDLWQELRGNLVPCFVRRKPSTPQNPLPTSGRHETLPPLATQAHPMFRMATCGGLRHRMRLLRGMVTGLELPDRVGYGVVRLSPGDVRFLARGAQTGLSAEGDARRRRLMERGLLLGAHGQERPTATRASSTPSAHWIPAPPTGGAMPATVEVGAAVPNPFHVPLWAAWRSGRDAVRFGAPGLEATLQRLEVDGDPLEDEAIPAGLTPHGSWSAWGEAVLERIQTASREIPWEHARLQDDAAALAWARSWCREWQPEGGVLPHDQELRELWILLATWRSPLLDLMEC